MNVKGRLKNDVHRMLGSESEMEPIKLYNGHAVTASSKSGFGYTTQPAHMVNLTTMQASNNVKTVGFFIDDFSEICGTNENFKDWVAEYTDGRGKLYVGAFHEIHINVTFNFVTATLTAIPERM